MSRLRRPSDQARTAQDRLAALFGPPVPQPPPLPTGPPEATDRPGGWESQARESQGWEQGQWEQGQWEQGGWELPPEEEPMARVPADPPTPRNPAIPPSPPAPAPAPAFAPEPRAALLPSPLRSGRWEPGRRGAVALVAVAALAAVLAGIFVLRSRPTEVTAPPVLRPVASASASPAGVVVVAVAGKVKRQGLVRLPAGARVDDALRAAGGMLPGTDVGLLNLARLLVDGEQLLVGIAAPPGSAEALPGPSVGGSARAPAAGAKVGLNAASVTDLDALPGIGPVLAQAIVDWRTEHGRFASIDQLREVPGIGEAKFATLRDKVRL